MAESVQFDLVSPERRLVSTEATEVQIPGAEGDLTAMAGHAPLITTLRPGVLKVQAGGEVQEYVVTGGFAEINASGISVLAERSLPRAEVTQEVIDAWVEEAHKAAKDAHPDVADAAAKLLADMVAVGGHIGLDPKQPSL